MQIADISSGSFFKPEEYAHPTYDALLVEVTDFERQRPSGFGPKDTAHVDITAFKGGDVVNEAQGLMIQQTILARDLERLVGMATIQYLTKGTASKPGQNAPWVWRKPEQPVYEQVLAYATARAEAEAAALESAPSF